MTGSELQDGEWMVEADGSKEEKLGAWTTVPAGLGARRKWGCPEAHRG